MKLSELLLAHRRWWMKDRRKHGYEDSDKAYLRYVESLSLLDFLNELTMFEEGAMVKTNIELAKECGLFECLDDYVAELKGE